MHSSSLSGSCPTQGKKGASFRYFLEKKEGLRRRDGVRKKREKTKKKNASSGLLQSRKKIALLFTDGKDRPSPSSRGSPNRRKRREGESKSSR